MNEPSEEPDIEAQRAELKRRLERVQRMKRRNDALEKSLISPTELKHKLQASFLILEDKCEQVQRNCIAQIAELVSPEVAEMLAREIQQTIEEALSEAKADYLNILKQ